MIVRNIDKQTIEVPYEGTTYIFPQGQVVEVDDIVGKFVKEKYPLSFSTGMQLKKKDAVPVQTYKTKVYTVQSPRQQQQAQSTNSESTITQIDSNDESWYGGGIQKDTLN